MHSEFCKAPLHHTAARFFRHKGQNLKAAGLKTSNNSSSVWFHALRVFLSVITTSMKATSSKQRQSSPCCSSSHPCDYPDGSYRRALFSGVLILSGQKNSHKQMLFYSKRVRLTFVQLSLQRHYWHWQKQTCINEFIRTCKDLLSYLSGSAPHPCLLPFCFFFFFK